MKNRSYIRHYKLVACLLIGLVSGCSSNTPKETASPGDLGLPVQPKNPDKFEAFNRRVFAFNMQLDRWILKPLAVGYRKIAPDPVEVGVSNFFSNLGEVSNVANDLMQGKIKQAGNDSGRLLLNSTLGLLGLLDVAQHAGLKKSDGEDFGQTLAAWGVPRGPFIMIPLLGPSTLRAAAAIPVEFYLAPENQEFYFSSEDQVTPDIARIALVGTNFVQDRAKYLDLEDLAQGDMYLFLRDTYLQRREYLIRDGKIVDDFGDDGFGDDDFGDVDFEL